MGLGKSPIPQLSLAHGVAWLAGELVAVGVVDVLPRCLSSAYLFWDPDWASLGLGKLTALKEIAWVQAASARCPALQWYHMVSHCRQGTICIVGPAIMSRPRCDASIFKAGSFLA